MNFDQKKTKIFPVTAIFSGLKIQTKKRELNQFLIGIHSMQGWTATTRPGMELK